MVSEYDEADTEVWAEAPPRDALDRLQRADDPFYSAITDEEAGEETDDD